MTKRTLRRSNSGEQPTTNTNQGGIVTTAPEVETRTDESLDQTWKMHLDALTNAEEHAAKAKEFEDQAAQHQVSARSLREQAAELERQARQADAAEQQSLSYAAQFRAAESKARDVAADHADTVNLKVQVSGRQHPAERLAKTNGQVTSPDGYGTLAADRGPAETQGMPVIDPADPLNTNPRGYPAAPAQNGGGQ